MVVLLTLGNTFREHGMSSICIQRSQTFLNINFAFLTFLTFLFFERFFTHTCSVPRSDQAYDYDPMFGTPVVGDPLFQVTVSNNNNLRLIG